MPNGKRTRPATWNYSASAKRAYSKRARSARSRGTTGMAGILRASVRRANQGVQRLSRMIETKESATSLVNTQLAHNLPQVVVSLLTDINQGTADPMVGGGNRIGDSLSLKGVLIKAFVQNQLQRSKVHYRCMVIKAAKGDVPTRATLFKGLSGNTMIDQINTERFTIMKQRVFTVNASNQAADAVLNPLTNGQPGMVTTGQAYGGLGTKIMSMWVPGGKFTRGGNIQFENGSTQPKFYNYYVLWLAYDWNATPQDINNIGFLPSHYYKTYYKDA